MAAKKVILIAAGLTCTVGLVFMMKPLFSSTKEVAGIVNADAANKIQQMKEGHITKYEHSFISGAAVVSYVEEIYDDVTAITITPLGKNAYNAKTVSENDLYRYMKTMSHDYYINPLNEFYIGIERNSNGVISGVTITEQE